MEEVWSGDVDLTVLSKWSMEQTSIPFCAPALFQDSSGGEAGLSSSLTECL